MRQSPLPVRIFPSLYHDSVWAATNVLYLDGKKIQAQQQATAAGGTQDTGQDDTDDQLTTLTRMLGDGTLLVQQLQNGHIISSQQIKVAEYSQNGSVDAVTQAYTQAGIFANYAGLLYDMQA